MIDMLISILFVMLLVYLIVQIILHGPFLKKDFDELVNKIKNQMTV